jgi:hypothetical protein
MDRQGTAAGKTTRRPAVIIGALVILGCTAFVNLGFAVWATLGGSIEIAGVRVRAHAPLRPLGWACFGAGGLLLVLARERSRDHVCRASGRVFLACGLVVFAIELLAMFVRSTPDAFPSGDAAVLELYTIYVTERVWFLGPYSQFGWHHPGPLLFYLLAPLYVLGGNRSIALDVMAGMINIAAVCTTVIILFRCAQPILTATCLAVLAVYVSRVHWVLTSYWNAHLLLMPLVATLVLAAAAASRNFSALPLLVFSICFLAQTHVALVPSCVVILVLTWSAGLIARWRNVSGFGRFWIWSNAGAWLFALLWLLPVSEQLTAVPGNFTQLFRFFVQNAHAGQQLTFAWASWSELLAAPLLPWFTAPVGWGYAPTASLLPRIAGTAVLMAAALSGHWAHQRRDRYHAHLTMICVAVSVCALWSIQRIEGTILDHAVFWVTGIGALMIALSVAGIILFAVTPRAAVLMGTRLRRTTLVAGTLLCLTVVTFAGVNLVSAREAAIVTRNTGSPIGRLSQALLDYLQQHEIQRPLIRIDQSVWGDAVGIVLQLHKSGRIRFSVDRDWISVVGTPLAPHGDEDRLIRLVPAIGPRMVHGLISEENGVRIVDEGVPGPAATR